MMEEEAEMGIPIVMADGARETSAENLFISICDAGRMLGVSERCVYGYMEEGSLPGFRAQSLTVLRKEDVLNYRRRPPGRLRTRTPVWHEPPVMNPASLTSITVGIRPGREQKFLQKMQEIRLCNKHLLCGTTARYIMHNMDKGNEVQIVLIWRAVSMPPEEERQAALAALFDDLAEVLDWQTAIFAEGVVVIHA